MTTMQVHVLASYRDEMQPPRGFCAIAVNHPGAPGGQSGLMLVRPTGVGSEATLPAALAKALSLIAEHPADVKAVVHVGHEEYGAITRDHGDGTTACSEARDAWSDVITMTTTLGDRMSIIGDLDPVQREALERVTVKNMSREGVPLRGPSGSY